MPTVNAIETLMAEHRLIERTLSAMEACARSVDAGADVAPAEVGRFARFLRSYADELHHGKEEDLLFERMVEEGFPREVGPIGMMRFEHDQGRALVRKLAELGAKEHFELADRHQVLEAAADFSELLRAHIQREDRILYPMAEQRLSQETMQRLEREVAEHLEKNAEKEKALVELAASLADAWGTEEATEQAGAELGCSVCGGH
jgi:hemerythrin-like domain-containing protein